MENSWNQCKENVLFYQPKFIDTKNIPDANLHWKKSCTCIFLPFWNSWKTLNTFSTTIQVYFRFICNALFIFLLFTLLFHYWRNTRVRNSKQKYFFLILFFISSKYRNIKQNVFETGTLECIKIFRLITHLCRCTLSFNLNTFYFRKYPREFIFPKSN